MPGYYDVDKNNVAPNVHSWPKPGLASVPQYQMSGVPAAGTLAAGETVTFTRVTRAITVVTAHNNVTINFNNTGQDAYPLIKDVPQRFEIMVTSITAVGDTVNFVAELTGIQAEQCPDWANDTNQLFTIA